MPLSHSLIRLCLIHRGWGWGQREAKQLIVSAWHLISAPQKVYYRSKTVIKPQQYSLLSYAFILCATSVFPALMAPSYDDSTQRVKETDSGMRGNVAVVTGRSGAVSNGTASVMNGGGRAKGCS